MDIKNFLTELKEILEFKIIEVSNYTLTLYHLLLFIGIIILIKLLVKGIELFVHRKIKGKNWIDEGKQFALMQLIKYFIYTVGIVIGLRSIGIDVTVLIFGSTALFVGLGFGLQEAFRDFVSGVILLFEGNVKVGDVIEMDNGLVGIVKIINLRTSKVRTRDGIMMVVPNSELVNKRVVNWSNSNKLTRFSVLVGVPHGIDANLIKDILLEVASKNDTIATRIPAFVRFSCFNESTLDFELHFWTEQVWRIETTKSNLRFAIYEKLCELKIPLPFNQMDLHIKSDFRDQQNKD